MPKKKKSEPPKKNPPRKLRVQELPAEPRLSPRLIASVDVYLEWYDSLPDGLKKAARHSETIESWRSL